ncbi:MAG: hypothetical protein IPN96_19545 [Anaerolineales bacterium]|nr:hypothetical protein [Anaerolineales bacterium]
MAWWSFSERRQEIRVTATLPGQSLIGPFQKIKLTFSEPVIPDLAASLFPSSLP